MSSARKSPSTPDLSFFPGFVWPVPAAFAGAISAFRFEPGDVLYRDAAGYAKPRRKAKKGARAIQVLERPAGSGAGNATPEGDPRRVNWESRVRIAVFDLATGASANRELTQGQLFRVLWLGEEAWLEGPSGDSVEMPHPARDLGQSLEAARDRVVARSADGSKARSGSRFLFVVDQSNDASRAKALTIEEGLAGLGEVERLDLTPAEAGVPEGERYHPALLIRCLTLPGQDVAGVTEVLRSRLYGGVGGVGGEAKADTGDRFSVARHGLLEALDPEAPA